MSVVRTACYYFYTYCTFQLNTYSRYALIGLEHAKTAVSCCHTFTVPFSSTLDALIHWIDIDWIEAKNSDALTMNRIESNPVHDRQFQGVMSCHCQAKNNNNNNNNNRSAVSYHTCTPHLLPKATSSLGLWQFVFDIKKGHISSIDGIIRVVYNMHLL